MRALPGLAVSGWALLAALSCSSGGGRVPPPSVFYTVTEDQLIWVDQARTERPFRELLIAPLRFRFSPLAWQTSDAAMVASARAYDRALRAVLADVATRVERPGEGVLGVDAALVDRVTRPELLRKADGKLFDATGKVGTVALLVEFRDTVSGELLAIYFSKARSHLWRAHLAGPLEEAEMARAYLPFAQRLKIALEQRNLQGMR